MLSMKNLFLPAVAVLAVVSTAYASEESKPSDAASMATDAASSEVKKDSKEGEKEKDENKKPEDKKAEGHKSAPSS